MLCPRCGRDVGDKCTLCEQCKKAVDAEKEDLARAEPKRNSSGAPSSSANYRFDEGHFPRLTIFLQSWMGILLCCFLSWVAATGFVLSVVENQGIIGSALLGLSLTLSAVSACVSVYLIMQLCMINVVLGLLSFVIPIILPCFLVSHFEHFSKKAIIVDVICFVLSIACWFAYIGHLSANPLAEQAYRKAANKYIVGPYIPEDPYKEMIKTVESSPYFSEQQKREMKEKFERLREDSDAEDSNAESRLINRKRLFPIPLKW